MKGAHSLGSLRRTLVKRRWSCGRKRLIVGFFLVQVNLVHTMFERLVQDVWTFFPEDHCDSPSGGLRKCIHLRVERREGALVFWEAFFLQVLCQGNKDATCYIEKDLVVHARVPKGRGGPVREVDISRQLYLRFHTFSHFCSYLPQIRYPPTAPATRAWCARSGRPGDRGIVTCPG